MCHALETFAPVARTLHGGLVAARVWGCVERTREDLASPITPSFQSWYAREVMAARAAVNDDAAFDIAWNEGRAMTLHQAVNFALNIESARRTPHQARRQ